MPNNTYNVLSYNFGGYDIVRAPLNHDSNGVFTIISDREYQSDKWNLVIDKKLAAYNTIYSSYYVRYHPFEYIPNADTIILVDASMHINEGIDNVIHQFNLSNKLIGTLHSRFITDEDKLHYWLVNRKAISRDELIRTFMWIDKCKQSCYSGSIGCGVMLVKREAIPILEEVWNTLFTLSDNPTIPIRTDEIVLNKILHAHHIEPFLIARQFIQSRFIQHYRHGTIEPLIYDVPDNTPTMYNNCPVTPFMPGEEFNREYTHTTEAMLLTKYLNPPDLTEWLEWHLNTVKFDHIHVFDNESDYDVKTICEHYGDKVSYERVNGQARQYQLYDRYTNKDSTAEWIMPIDDDEFLDIGNFASIADALQYYRKKFPFSHKLAIRWKHLFPKKFHSERTGKVLDYCTEFNPELAKSFIQLGDGAVKTIVHRYGNIHYEETWENPAGGHVPTNGYSYGATLCNGQNVSGCGIPNCPEELPDERIRLLHCRYKGYSEYTQKMKEVVTVSDATPRKKHFKFDDLLETLE
jgi:hypothetical protein